MKLWLNGQIVAADRAHIDPADRGFLLGDGLFETLLAQGGQVCRGHAHFKRLRQGAEYLAIPLDMPDAALLDACAELLQVNALAEARASLRLTLTRGPGPRGLLPPAAPAPTIMITAAPAPPPPRDLSVITSSVRRNELGPLTRYKTLNYLENICARREAQTQGADEAVMLNSAGNAACASAATLWIVERGVLVTPPVADGALPGTARARVFDVAPELALSVREETISPARLAAAQEVFLSNALIGACPVRRLDGRALTPRLGLRIRDALVDS